jgi:hypothetical protein
MLTIQEWHGSCYISRGLKQAHAEAVEEVMGHATEQREVGGTLRASSQRTRFTEIDGAD